MMHLCRELFPTLLETEGKLSELMLKLFNPSRYLHEDIVNNHLETEFKDYIYSNLEPSNEILLQTHKTPQELLSIAGYDLYECTNDSELQSFKKYYKEEVAEKIRLLYVALSRAKEKIIELEHIMSFLQ